MAQERPSTPEKQLLKLIEDPKTQGFGTGRVLKRKGGSLFSFAALKGRVSFFREKIASAFSFKGKSFDVKAANGILQLSIFILSIYFVVNLVMSMKSSMIPEIDQDAAASIELGSPQEVSILKKPPYYLEKARSRDIFSFGRFFQKVLEEEVVIPPPEEEEKEPTKLEQAAERFSLVGIAWSDDPDAMIEDSSTQKIYFLKRGQSLEGMKVEAILRDRVILSYEGEELELW